VIPQRTSGGKEKSDPLTLEPFVVLQPEAFQLCQGSQLLRYLPWNEVPEGGHKVESKFSPQVTSRETSITPLGGRYPPRTEKALYYRK